MASCTNWHPHLAIVDNNLVIDALMCVNVKGELVVVLKKKQ